MPTKKKEYDDESMYNVTLSRVTKIGRQTIRPSDALVLKGKVLSGLDEDAVAKAELVPHQK